MDSGFWGDGEKDKMIQLSQGQIADDLYALGNPALPAFLLAAATPVLFDAGMTFMGPGYLKDLRKYLGDPSRLQYLLLTHSHYDHCGGAPYLKRRISGLKAGASRTAAEVLKRPNAVQLIQSLSRESEEKFKSQTGGEDVSFGGLEIDLFLADGDELDLGRGAKVRVLATPGHTRDALSFYLPGRKILVSGEAAGAYGKFFQIRAEFLSSYADYMASLEKMAALEIDTLLLGHGYFVTGEEARGFMAKSIESTLQFKQRIEEDLARLGGDEEKVVQKIHREDYIESQIILQDERPYLINLRAMVKAAAAAKS